MENHHHCKDCGNMINPSLKVCRGCESKQQIKRIEDWRKKVKK